MSPNEYLRRNIMVAKSCGAKAEVAISLRRLQSMRHAPKWLLTSLTEMQMRLDKIPDELAEWRDAAPDNPYSQRP